MALAEVKNNADQKMAKSIEALKVALSRIRTGRAQTSLLDHVQVEYYGNYVPISQVANVTLIDSRTVGVSPWEKKMSQVIDKAIRESDLGLNPMSVGDLIRIPMPPLSEERRKELAKVVKGEGEHAKIAVRNLRREANEQFKKLLKDKEISEDEERRSQDEVQKLTDRYIVDIDSLLAVKEREILTV